jgi:hypothetical protein
MSDLEEAAKKSNSVKAIIGVVTATVGLLGMAATGIFWIDDRYAKTPEFVELKNEVTLIELKEQLREAQQEYFFLRKQARVNPNDEELQEELQEAKEVVDELKKLIKELNKKKLLDQ